MTLEALRARAFDPRVYPILILALVGAVAALFYFLGFQENLRWIKALIGLGVVATLVATRLSTALGVFLFASVFPTYVIIGPTNFVLVVPLFVAWLIRASRGSEPGLRRTPCDIPLALLTLAFLISWVNVSRDPFSMTQAWWYSQNQIGGLMIFYMAYASIRDDRDIRILVRFLQALAVLVYLNALMEVSLGVSLTALGGLRGVRYAIGDGQIRVGGILGSHDLTADFCSMNLPLHLYLLARATRPSHRFFYGALAVLAVVTLFSTSNRGGVVGLFVGIAYLGFLLRKDIGATAMAAIATGTIVLFVAVDQVLSAAGRTLSVFTRIAKTQFYGVLPETRTGVWEYFKSRVSNHFWIGEGPYYDLRPTVPGEFVFWPHNAIGFYWVTIGLLGVVAFLWLVARIIVTTFRERAHRFGEGYAREMLLMLHVMVVVFFVTQQRTDFQRGFVYTYHVFFLFGFAMGTWRLVRDRRLSGR